MPAAQRYYYLHNFQRALSWICERYGDVLGDAEQQFVGQFERLERHSQALMVRMLMRRGPWFRVSQLAYDEIPDPTLAAEPLLGLGWLDPRPAMAASELATLYTKAELAQQVGAPLHSRMRKADMLDALRQMHAAPQPFAQWCPQAAESPWRVMVGDLCDRLRLMFFGNLRQTWSEFVLADLGIFRYEEIALDTGSRAFQAREDVDTYLRLHACRLALDEDPEPDVESLLQVALGCRSRHAWIEQRRARLLLRIGQRCERMQDWPRAEQAYGLCDAPGARHRRMRLYERTERYSDALALAVAAQASPESDEEQQRVARMLPRLRRRLGPGESAVARPEPAAAPARMDLVLPRTDKRVEHALIDHWHTEDAPVFYVENALINSLFGLLCWPAVFLPVPGAFFHPFQSGPADLGAPDFARRRASAFDACLQALDDGTYRSVILQRFASKQGVQSPFVAWGVLNGPLLQWALECIPAAHLALFFRRLLRDLSANRTGLPDLVRFWPAERRYELVEVKGPGDHLQDNQIRWLQYCAEHGLPVCVCHVRWQDATAWECKA